MSDPCTWRGWCWQSRLRPWASSRRELRVGQRPGGIVAFERALVCRERAADVDALRHRHHHVAARHDHHDVARNHSVGPGCRIDGEHGADRLGERCIGVGLRADRSCDRGADRGNDLAVPAREVEPGGARGGHRSRWPSARPSCWPRSSSVCGQGGRWCRRPRTRRRWNDPAGSPGSPLTSTGRCSRSPGPRVTGVPPTAPAVGRRSRAPPSSPGRGAGRRRDFAIVGELRAGPSSTRRCARTARPAHGRRLRR